MSLDYNNNIDTPITNSFKEDANGNYLMYGKTFYGMESILADELKKLGAQRVEMHNRMVSFYGDLGFMYKANLCLRTALFILKPIVEFEVKNERHLYKNIYNIEWEKFIGFDNTISVKATINSHYFDHSKFVALKSKDAIVDRFRDKFGDRPNVDIYDADLQINIHIYDNKCTVSLNSSGESLHKRGYKTQHAIAPMNEVLAAGMLKLSGWENKGNLLDPMCGSGTILIEAAMTATGIPAGICREKFAYENWKNFDKKLDTLIYNSAIGKIKKTDCKIVGYDISKDAVNDALENIKNLELDNVIEIKNRDFFDSKKEMSPTLLVFNPPYNERLKFENEDFYEKIGTTLKHNYPDTWAWFITSNLESLKSVGLKTSRRIVLYNGKLECRLVKYELYSGSKKTSKKEEIV